MVITGLMVMAGVVLYLAGKIVFFALLGGTSRALVNYFASGTELRAREVFRTVRARWWQLIGATIMVIILVMGVLAMAYMVFAFLFIIYVTLSTWVISGLPNWLQVIAHTVFGLTVAAGLLLLFLLVYSRVIFVPQALMVEEKGVFSAIGRSMTLAGRDVRRIAAILAFQIYIAWSLLLLLVIPLGWYGYLNGIDINPFGGGAPLWYNIAQQTLTQLSEILLAPIAMLSFTLLYLDVRVRKEGFDVELLANRLSRPQLSCSRRYLWPLLHTPQDTPAEAVSSHLALRPLRRRRQNRRRSTRENARSPRGDPYNPSWYHRRCGLCLSSHAAQRLLRAAGSRSRGC